MTNSIETNEGEGSKEGKIEETEPKVISLVEELKEKGLNIKPPSQEEWQIRENNFDARRTIKWLRDPDFLEFLLARAQLNKKLGRDAGGGKLEDMTGEKIEVNERWTMIWETILNRARDGVLPEVQELNQTWNSWLGKHEIIGKDFLDKMVKEADVLRGFQSEDMETFRKTFYPDITIEEFTQRFGPLHERVSKREEEFYRSEGFTISFKDEKTGKTFDHKVTARSSREAIDRAYDYIRNHTEDTDDIYYTKIITEDGVDLKAEPDAADAYGGY